MSYKSFSHLIEWSNTHYSHLPWRRNRTLYGTLVSEIMLQQTTVGTVVNYFENFLNEYPTIFDLAKSSDDQVCISWKGLGYYRRARNLRNLAIQIVERYKGKIPTDIESLLGLKGIGLYTANAIKAIGADEKGLAVDANLERVLSRFYGMKGLNGAKLKLKLFDEFKSQKILTEIDQLGPRSLNEALMDLGRALCQARKTKCEECPLKGSCKAFLSGDLVEILSEKKKKDSKNLYIKLLRVIVRDKNKILFYQKGSDEWLSGQWELPTFILDTNDEKLKQYPKIKTKKSFESLPGFKTAITKYKIENAVVEMPLDNFKTLAKGISVEYCFKNNSKDLNISTASLKSLESK